MHKLVGSSIVTSAVMLSQAVFLAAALASASTLDKSEPLVRPQSKVASAPAAAGRQNPPGNLVAASQPAGGASASAPVAEPASAAASAAIPPRAASSAPASAPDQSGSGRPASTPTFIKFFSKLFDVEVQSDKPWVLGTALLLTAAALAAVVGLPAYLLLRDKPSALGAGSGLSSKWLVGAIVSSALIGLFALWFSLVRPVDDDRRADPDVATRAMDTRGPTQPGPSATDALLARLGQEVVDLRREVATSRSSGTVSEPRLRDDLLLPAAIGLAALIAVALVASLVALTGLTAMLLRGRPGLQPPSYSRPAQASSHVRSAQTELDKVLVVIEDAVEGRDTNETEKKVQLERLLDALASLLHAVDPVGPPFEWSVEHRSFSRQTLLDSQTQLRRALERVDAAMDELFSSDVQSGAMRLTSAMRELGRLLGRLKPYSLNLGPGVGRGTTIDAVTPAATRAPPPTR